MMLNSFGIQWTWAMIDSVISNALLLAGCLLIVNTFRYYLPTSERYGYILAMCAIISLVWLFISKWIINLIQPAAHEVFFSESIYVRLAIGFLIIGSMALLSVLWFTLQDQQQNEKRKSEAEKLAREAELYKLRQQLQPHFLFNSLNSISALVVMKPELARKMIQQLSDFLRGILRKEENQWVSLSEELQLLQLYLDIEKVRFGHRLSTIIEHDELSGAMKLPALLLQPVVENAIKFGLYDTTGDISISIKAITENGMLVVTVENPYDPSTSLPQKGTGFGLSSVQRRLYLLFARNDLLQISSQDHLFRTIIKVPQ
ncbi:MAG TPA: histidine kinase [Chitinophagaceae bacterium]|nr:histidine kinase [Chitinophagaceae bacterium]